MNGDEQIEVHYMDNGYSYPVPEGYVDYFGGAPTAPLNYLNFSPMLDDQAVIVILCPSRNFTPSLYWSMHMNSYKYGQCDPEGNYYGLYKDNDLALRMDSSRRIWQYSSMANTENLISVGIPSEQSMVSEVHSIPEEREPNDRDAASAQVSWQDDVDPDTMTYVNVNSSFL